MLRFFGQFKELSSLDVVCHEIYSAAQHMWDANMLFVYWDVVSSLSIVDL